MRLLVSLVSFLLTLIGCNPQSGVTTVSIASVDGVGVNSTKSRITQDHARFECLKSVSGQCHYVVYVSSCTGGAMPRDTDDADAENAGNSADATDMTVSANASGASDCATRTLQQFTLAAGQVRELDDMPVDVRHCVDHDAMPVAPGCGRKRE
ncbi:hypothetical protein ACYX7E_11935 [Luteimonas sp. RIT-PG2_3]